MCVCVCVRACVRVCVLVCVSVCARVCVQGLEEVERCRKELVPGLRVKLDGDQAGRMDRTT